jgi:hypothetical protein
MCVSFMDIVAWAIGAESSVHLCTGPTDTNVNEDTSDGNIPDDRTEGRLHREIERALHPIIEDPGNASSISRDVELADYLEQPGNASSIPRYQVD